VAKTADYNFSESAHFIEQLSQAAERNPNAVRELALRMDNLQPNVRSEFIDVTMRVAKRSEGQAAARLTSTSNSKSGEKFLQDLGTATCAPFANRSATTPEKTEVILRR
jgi:hypothetical protein